MNISPAILSYNRGQIKKFPDPNQKIIVHMISMINASVFYLKKKIWCEELQSNFTVQRDIQQCREHHSLCGDAYTSQLTLRCVAQAVMCAHPLNVALHGKIQRAHFTVYTL
ncbi:hypothetical protein KSP39_PZI007657 [Platanthera zijinensis]|uniref:Uncharacterized protein n=1 Tax=Platanthera zijinensis TaxID=2320716 RepID=A0AAP0BMA7_9ASPA